MSLRQPPPHVGATFEFMGAVGIIINIILFVADIVSDGVLAFVLYKQTEDAIDPSTKDQTWTWFIITVCIIVIPMVILNIFSLLWYWQNKVCLGDYCVLHKMSRSQKVFRVFIHFVLLGPLIRYVDILRYGVKMRKEVKEVEMGESGAILRRTPKGEVHAVLQMVISRDTSMLDMMHSFLQDAPQLIFQIYLLYRSPDIITRNTSNIKTIAVQVWKILLGVTSISWSLVSYQDELRRTIPNKDKLTCGATLVCLIWRAAMIASRIIAIATFSSTFQEEGDNSTLFSLPRRNLENQITVSFPIVTAVVLLVHWLLMTAWIHAQGTNFCATEDGRRRSLLELFYNAVMGMVHIFCYINVKDTPSRRRMIFFYAITLLENTAMITVWYIIEKVNYDAWFCVTMVFSVEALWVLGVCAVIGYYAFLHPDREHLGTNSNQASWRQ